jgi:hypothetical protein
MHNIIFSLENLKGRELGRTKRRWEDNIRIDLREIMWEVVGCMLLAQDIDQW